MRIGLTYKQMRADAYANSLQSHDSKQFWRNIQRAHNRKSINYMLTELLMLSVMNKLLRCGKIILKTYRTQCRVTMIKI